MKHNFTVLIAFTCLFIQVNAGVTYKVRQTPQSGEYASIREALIQCSNATSLETRDTIDVLGVFTDSVRINKSVVIRGHGWDNTILQTYSTKQLVSPATDFKSVVIISGGASVHLLNLAVRNGYSTTQGGGIRVALNNGGKVKLEKLKVYDNFSTQHSGGIAVIGSNVEIISCFVTENRSTTVGGGGIHIVSNNGGEDSRVLVNGCTVSHNVTSSATGGGISVDGNTTFGNQKMLDVVIENTTIAFNESASSGAGFFGKGIAYAGTPASDTNTKIWFNHCTIAYNKVTTFSANTTGVGFALANVTGTTGMPRLDIHNTIITKNEVKVDESTNKNDVNFNKASLDSVTNSIFGVTYLLANAATNINVKTARFDVVQLDNELKTEGSIVPVLPLLSGSIAIDSIHINYAPLSVDQRGFLRDSKSDIGSYEYGANNISSVNLIYEKSLFRILNNPVDNYVQVVGPADIRKIKIFSISGALIYDSENNSIIDVSRFRPGNYIIRIQTTDSICNLKFIKI